MVINPWRNGLWLLCIGIFWLSCRKEKPIPAPAPDSQTTIDNAVAEAEYTSVLNDTNYIGISEDGVQKTGTYTCDTSTNMGTAVNVGCFKCVNITVTPCWKDTATWPKNATIDFIVTV